MDALPKSQLLRFVEQAMQLAQRAVAHSSSKFSKWRYTLHQHIVLLCLKVRKNTTYRTLLDELILRVVATSLNTALVTTGCVESL